jgi:hypothetical protein
MLVPTRAAMAAVTALLALALLGMPVHAADGDPSPSAAELRSQADAIATRYFDALARYQDLDREIMENKQAVAALAVRARTARSDAREAALSEYRASSAQLPSIVSSGSALTAARRILLIQHVKARDHATYRRLHTATKQLDSRRRALEADHQQQAAALAQLQEESSAMEAKLALAQQQEQVAIEQAARETAAQAEAQAAVEPTGPTPTTETTAPPTTAPPTTTAPPAKQPAPKPPPGYVGKQGTNPKHDDPFLSCVRARESGGNYSVVNPAGPYLGAYQFLQATWNGAANHAGRTDLVGVPANLATPYDQDEVAWALYQWQGAGPWGGCP